MSPRNIPDFQGDLYDTLDFIGRLYEGDHVEVGTRHGASAIKVARARAKGIIYCIDPLENQMFNQEYGNVQETGHSATLKAIIEREELIDRIVLIQAYSQPWPLPEEQRFVSGFIDGCHIHPVPMWDWDAMSKVVDNAIVLDNVDLPGLLGCITRIRMDKDWRLKSTSKRTAIAWKLPS